ncbi:sugar ABC transporter permease [Alteromonadales bacterium alter-6D02]|nr:sugar ABC transporter permease [Alteromonadales bacterium alter-6D02]
MVKSKRSLVRHGVVKVEPWWFNSLLLPLVNICLALLACVVVLWLIGIDIINGIEVMFFGALGQPEGIAYTLFYATNFIFSGLGVALAWHAGLFNIGGEGQATLGGVGITVACLSLDGWSFGSLFVLAVMLSALFGAAWAFIPGWLNAYRGSHVVITTILFNLLAAALVVYLLTGPMKSSVQMAAVSEVFPQAYWLPTLDVMAQWFGITIERNPLNISLFWALICCLIVHVYLWHSRLGYETRLVGQNMKAALFAGVNEKKIIIITMMLSGMLVGFIGLNELLGNSHQLHAEFVSGFGFAGIAVALMGRSSPLGIIAASILFGVIYQGGSELAFSVDSVGNDIILLIQGLIVLFCGALEKMLKPTLMRVFKVGVHKHHLAEQR